MNWFTQQRQAWIAEMLNVYGFINREHLERKFGISTPQASHDLQAFSREHPDEITYDLTMKCYVRIDDPLTTIISIARKPTHRTTRKPKNRPT